MSNLKYLAGYPQQIIEQVEPLIKQDKLGVWLLKRYPTAHTIQSEKALYQYVTEIKNRYLKKSAPITKICFDSKIQVINHALGTHSYVSRRQGNKIKTKNEIRIATIFKKLPEPLLEMIVVHELAHIKEKQHDKAFYSLCQHMQPQYHQLELDTRLFLTYLENHADLY
ncbi:DUF45 domain-containing protein [Vibrio sp. SS-MA-C1-2]|uniref:M48 family metallopeptidase n=1 Tax=Vibrio sp. SS-MA-C1-2 TaxID=2908646 RepID=UPI001F3A3D17|nr:YgjP-like metallopeptidase domain-containing protein [Vibrio sp. SS-MA-C1-2]UJF17393.1 DUF45 domain-containing protein [Vibrio sp. SS-MA-C1-2]